MRDKIDLEKVYTERIKPALTPDEAEAMEKAIREMRIGEPQSQGWQTGASP